MKIDIVAQIVDLDGTQIEGLTLRTIAIASLLNQIKGDESMDGGKKAKLFTLAMNLHSVDKDVDLPVEDIALIKERIGRAYGPLIVGRAFQLLDPK